MLNLNWKPEQSVADSEKMICNPLSLEHAKEEVSI